MISLAAWVDRAARAHGLDAGDARTLAAHALGCTRTQLLTRDGPPAGAAAVAIEALLARRAAGEPVAYLTGEREFWSRPFRVTRDVLIPRPDTELLVELALAWLRRDDGLARLQRHDGRAPAGTRPCVLDLGTGSGIVAVTLAIEAPHAGVTATDRSPAALAVARDNARRLGAPPIDFRQGDWYAALPADARFDMIASNPPYIVADDPHLAAGDLPSEPREALASGDDGLDAIRAIVAGAPARLAAGGVVLIEHGWDQAGAVRGLLGAAGLAEPRSWRDLAGIERVSGAVRPG